MLCILETHEKLACVNLMSTAFAQQANLSELALNDFAQTVFAFKENEKIISIVCAANVSSNGKNGHYLFGGATVPEFQNNGYFTQVLTFAKSNLKGDFIFVLQNEHDEFYKKLGFENAFAMRKTSREIKRNLWAVAEFDTVTAKKLSTLRQKYILNNFIIPEKPTALLTGLYSQGITSAETSNAYALYYRQKETLEVVELYAETDNDAMYLLEAMANHEGRNFANIFLSNDNTVFAGEGRKFFAGMACGNFENLKNIYQGPMII